MPQLALLNLVVLVSIFYFILSIPVYILWKCAQRLYTYFARKDRNLLKSTKQKHVSAKSTTVSETTRQIAEMIIQQKKVLGTDCEKLQEVQLLTAMLWLERRKNEIRDEKLRKIIQHMDSDIDKLQNNQIQQRHSLQNDLAKLQVVHSMKQGRAETKPQVHFCLKCNSKISNVHEDSVKTDQIIKHYLQKLSKFIP